ncbi:MAG: glycerol-3-phosphate 1-O-acyltransferase PlsY [Thermovirgaceae bacterium]|nr:glycerol-3-phosphate 1-O-acyltransferase PlsY [Thermovirgaceae bacterium]
MTSLIWVLAGYLFGSVPAGYLAVKLVLGEDIRKLGSGNIGATNVSRFLGKKWGVAVAVFDMAKGGIVVLAARLLGMQDPWILAFAGFAGVCGHNFPVWLGFRGGKGVATSFGVIFFWNPVPALAGGIAWYLVMRFTKYVSVGSMVSLMTVPVWFLFLRQPQAYFWVSSALAALAVVRHRGNIANLLGGREERIGGEE